MEHEEVDNAWVQNLRETYVNHEWELPDPRWTAANFRYYLWSIPVWWLDWKWQVFKYNLPKWYVTEENAFWNERWFGRWVEAHGKEGPPHRFFVRPVRRAFVDKAGEYREIDNIFGRASYAR